MKESCTQTVPEHIDVGAGELKHQQVSFKLPLITTSTQTDSRNDLSPFLIQTGHTPAVFLATDMQPQMVFNEKVSHLDPQNVAVANSTEYAKDMLGPKDGCDLMIPEKRSTVEWGKHKNELSSYVIALRPWSFPASITPVALGSCLAYKSQGVFDVSIFFTTIFAAMCVHAAGNLVNTYFDFVRGIDNKKSDDRTIVDNILSPNDVASLGTVFYIAGCLGFMLLNFLSPARMEHLALVYFCGLSSSFFYTGGLGLKYIAMGDILIVLTFGPLTVVFSYLSQAGQLSLTPLIYAIPLALNTEAILHCNNARDMDSDRQAGIITLAILLGHTGSYFLFCLLLFLPYLLFITVGIHYSAWMLLPASSIFIAFRLEKQFRRRDLAKIPQKVAMLNFILGLLYILSILFSNSDSLPTMTAL